MAVPTQGLVPAHICNRTNPRLQMSAFGERHLSSVEIISGASRRALPSRIVQLLGWGFTRVPMSVTLQRPRSSMRTLSAVKFWGHISTSKEEDALLTHSRTNPTIMNILQCAQNLSSEGNDDGLMESTSYAKVCGDRESREVLEQPENGIVEPGRLVNETYAHVEYLSRHFVSKTSHDIPMNELFHHERRVRQLTTRIGESTIELIRLHRYDSSCISTKGSINSPTRAFSDALLVIPC